MYQVSLKVFVESGNVYSELIGRNRERLGEGVSAYLVWWKDIDHNAMSKNFVYILVSRWQLG